MSKPGKLYGIGVGPGDPDLMTLKAARLIGEVPVIAYFRKRGAAGNARAIAGPHLRSGCREIAFDYPLTTEVPSASELYRGELGAFYDHAAEKLSDQASKGDVAVLCEGDPFLYGSFMHVYGRLSDRFEIEIVPGVTGMSACWSRAATPMTFGDDVLTVLPGTLPYEALLQRMRLADALVVMKLGRNFTKVREALIAAGVADRAVYVERGTMPGECIVPLPEKRDDEAPYFSMIIVPGRGRRL